MAAASFEALLSAYTAHEGGGQAMVVALQSAYEEIGIINITDYKTYNTAQQIYQNHWCKHLNGIGTFTQTKQSNKDIRRYAGGIRALSR